jgi:hypothetical protein
MKKVICVINFFLSKNNNKILIFGKISLNLHFNNCFLQKKFLQIKKKEQ